MNFKNLQKKWVIALVYEFLKNLPKKWVITSVYEFQKSTKKVGNGLSI